MIKKLFLLTCFFFAVTGTTAFAIPQIIVVVRVEVTFHPVIEIYEFQTPNEILIRGFEPNVPPPAVEGCAQHNFFSFDGKLTMRPGSWWLGGGSIENPTTGVWGNEFTLKSDFYTTMSRDTYKVDTHYATYTKHSDGRGGETKVYFSGEHDELDLSTSLIWIPWTKHLRKNTFTAAMKIHCIDSEGNQRDVPPLTPHKKYPLTMYQQLADHEATRIDEGEPDYDGPGSWKVVNKRPMIFKERCDTSQVETTWSYEEVFETTLSFSLGIRSIPVSLQGTIKTSNKNTQSYHIVIERGEKGSGEEWELSKTWRIDEFIPRWDGTPQYTFSTTATEHYFIGIENVTTCSSAD